MENKTPHFYERIEFYISVGAFIISIVSLYFAYLSSPLSDISRPQITYRTFQTVGEVSRDGTKEIRIACELLNPTKNPAEDVVVSIQTDIKNTPKIDILGGLEYQVLKNDGKSTAIKFPIVPPQSGSVVRFFGVLDPGDPLSKMSGELFLHFTKVHHKHGPGERE